MKERPILFRAPMVLAILAGVKTMTRRVIKGIPQGDHYGRDIMDWPLSGCETDNVGRHWLRVQTDVDDNSTEEIFCPQGKPGDRLWVKETWRTSLFADDRPPRETNHGLPFWYEADGYCNWTGSTTGGLSFVTPGKIRQSIFMPRWGSRINLNLTGVRVERLQDISEEDAISEGANPCTYSFPEGETAVHALDVGGLYRNGFRNLWDSINGKKTGKTWADNPFVWVEEFKRII